MIKVSNIVLNIEESMEKLKIKAARKIGIHHNEIIYMNILKESIDARKKDTIKFTYTVEVKVKNEEKLGRRLQGKDISVIKKKSKEKFPYGEKPLNNRPVVVGMGPAGLFAGLTLAKHGYKPLIIERGSDVDKRTEEVQKFWETGKLNLNSNVQFGEGGAGTFSDGKLTTRIKDIRCTTVVEEMVKAGAPEEILYKNKPHIGTDILKDVVKNIREEIIELGGEVRFGAKLEEVIIKDNVVTGIKVNGELISCDVIIMAIGHSARDTYEMLYEKGVHMESKPFAIGVRVEHPQTLIDTNQYGIYAGHERLKAAEYKLTYTTDDKERSVYSFCMCPGGFVVAAASEENRVVTNGMSYYARDNENANSAVVVSVGNKDFGDNPMDAIAYQRKYEELAFKTGGGDYKAPVQLIKDFMVGKKTTDLLSVKPTYTPGYTLANMEECLPIELIEPLREGFENFERKIKGFTYGDGIMVGVETRTSAPVRMNRRENLQSLNIDGLYPCGEGAGYAGGIISAAVDGIKCGEEIMKNWAK
ncbi:NAD(P)/FAD-dependent oxidoreductase [Oceanirhabdus sp. W0125-5]|uniref:NAD(P)/FAD-dependent oxidoreductase n=1 Tax=Oceanirhabdus sp. W0125-5 TaxID=2999116 RepID=UPI0022F2A5D5|nr:NAD(P)/FAD-dependent oxidoreductase [Oceanirhabdus sp. W0125-5]WBW98054.1 NAD(P)/FAD-dependent oxidoreductase [Oceanirhabdus sp. W0125-5]